ncbi:uncharacterized protein CC84DRAFT_722004 [Paraphaeosphaeria sporulosa]|uniref:Uncharacterized protein n=1 Tax=Paraphaeosphaeria sporulosa TaxID=1460663 RepID=A0A177CF19_9PLEO|nr:uncharacterized protein CC84DRAFT_722004 [Paraphaeosphaeria sporulosa]OAG05418.1 hypothetical protein CC84DRAFT_722004 [Paraphaeosphaeria sporulosa]
MNVSNRQTHHSSLWPLQLREIYVSLRQQYVQIFNYQLICIDLDCPRTHGRKGHPWNNLTSRQLSINLIQGPLL